MSTLRDGQHVVRLNMHYIVPHMDVRWSPVDLITVSDSTSFYFQSLFVPDIKQLYTRSTFIGIIQFSTSTASKLVPSDVRFMKRMILDYWYREYKVCVHGKSCEEHVLFLPSWLLQCMF